MRLLIFSFFLSIIVSVSGFSQEAKFIRSPFRDTVPGNIYSGLNEINNRDLQQIEIDSKKAAKNLETLFGERNDRILQEFNAGNFILNGPVYDYLQGIKEKIINANPKIDTSINVYPYRSASVNSVCFGQQIIGIHLGLLSTLESEDQCAFVICHELAHSLLQHSNDKLIQLAKKYADKDFTKQLKRIKRNSYNQYSELSEVSLALQYSVNKHSRNKEIEADSLAVIFYSNTSYSKNAVLETMEILDKIDYIPSPRNIDFKKHFSFDEFPFKDEWLSYQPSRWKVDQMEIPDSMKTHPECKNRMEAINDIWMELQSIQTNQDNSTPNSIKVSSHFEIINSFFCKKQYGMALYQSLLTLDGYPDNTFLNSMIGQCLYYIHEYRVDHKLTEVVDLPGSQYTESYDRFLTFIQNLRLSEVAGLSYYYALNAKNRNPNEFELWYNLWQSAKIYQDGVDQVEIYNSMKNQFPNRIN